MINRKYLKNSILPRTGYTYSFDCIGVIRYSNCGLSGEERYRSDWLTTTQTGGNN